MAIVYMATKILSLIKDTTINQTRKVIDRMAKVMNSISFNGEFRELYDRLIEKMSNDYEKLHNKIDLHQEKMSNHVLSIENRLTKLDSKLDSAIEFSRAHDTKDEARFKSFEDRIAPVEKKVAASEVKTAFIGDLWKAIGGMPGFLAICALLGLATIQFGLV